MTLLGAAARLGDSVTTIQGRLVSLRPVSRDDYPTLFRWRSSFDDIHLLNFRRRVATFEEFVRELESMLAGGAILLLVRRAKAGDPIGYVMGVNVNPWDGTLEIAMYVEPRYQVKGFGGETALLFVDWLFKNYPLRHVTAATHEFNEQAMALCRAMGAEEAGMIPDNYWHGDRFWATYMFVLTRERWVRRREDFVGIIQLQARFEGVHIAGPTHSGFVERGVP
jgi:RimJ/RimL family protein N-acetyltransferase